MLPGCQPEGTMPQPRPGLRRCPCLHARPGCWDMRWPGAGLGDCGHGLGSALLASRRCWLRTGCGECAHVHGPAPCEFQSAPYWGLAWHMAKHMPHKANFSHATFVLKPVGNSLLCNTIHHGTLCYTVVHYGTLYTVYGTLLYNMTYGAWCCSWMLTVAPWYSNPSNWRTLMIWNMLTQITTNDVVCTCLCNIYHISAKHL